MVKILSDSWLKAAFAKPRIAVKAVPGLGEELMKRALALLAAGMLLSGFCALSASQSAAGAPGAEVAAAFPPAPVR